MEEEEEDQVLEQQCNETVIMIIMKMMMIKFNYKTCVYTNIMQAKRVGLVALASL